MTCHAQNPQNHTGQGQTAPPGSLARAEHAPPGLCGPKRANPARRDRPLHITSFLSEATADPPKAGLVAWDGGQTPRMRTRVALDNSDTNKNEYGRPWGLTLCAVPRYIRAIWSGTDPRDLGAGRKTPLARVRRYPRSVPNGRKPHHGQKDLGSAGSARKQCDSIAR